MNDPRFEVFPKAVGYDEDPHAGHSTSYFWRFRAANGQITAIGGEGFTRREDAHRAVEDFARTLYQHTFEIATDPPAPTRYEFPAIVDVDD